MKDKITRLISTSLSVILALTLAMMSTPLYAYANETAIDPVIVVSLGDSYSSGEGIEPFYGQEKTLVDKVTDEDWLSHRSKKSWPAMLEIPGIEGTLKDYKAGSGTSAPCEWYFKACSGAETKNIKSIAMTKNYRKKYYNGSIFPSSLKGSVDIPAQLSVFDEIGRPADYVTLSIGGNDVGFAEVITICATGSTYLGSKKLEKKIEAIWNEFAVTQENIKTVYNEIQNAAGVQAEIIVAGYPKLLDKEGKGFLISKKEATLVNANVTKFNERLKSIVSECHDAGINIHFVDVEEEFDKDGGHQAYSDVPWINSIIFGSKAEDIDDYAIASSYSVHPNELGAQAYARCVNAKIAEIEMAKNSEGQAEILITDGDVSLEIFTHAEESEDKSGTLPEVIGEVPTEDSLSEDETSENDQDDSEPDSAEAQETLEESLSEQNRQD